MPSLQIRDLPDDLYQALAFRARNSPPENVAKT